MHGAAALGLARQSSASQRIPGCGDGEMDFVDDSPRGEDVLLPVRKAYRSTNSLAHSSFRSEGAGMLLAGVGDTPRSSQDSFRVGSSGRDALLAGSAGAQAQAQQHEGKVRGGLPRSISAPGLHMLYSRHRGSNDSISNG